MKRARLPTVFLSGCSALCAAFAADPLPVELTLVDEDATHYGTYQSNNQKIVSNRRGIFMTHLRSRNAAYTAQQWRLSWSKDGGKSFTTIHESTDATNPPVIETDAADNIYVARPDFVSLDVLLYRFLASEDYRSPHITRAPKSAAGKYAMTMHEPRGELCYFSHNGAFIRFGLDGAVCSRVELLKHGATAYLQYPQVQCDGAGILHAAWTTLTKDTSQHRSIHYLQSPDGGASWRTMNGAPVSIPAIADEGGPADRITTDEQLAVPARLASFLVAGGKAHFMYLSRSTPGVQHFVRYDLRSGSRELDLQPELRGGKLAIENIDGYLAARTRGGATTIYALSQEKGGPRLVCLASDDGGATWRDHAASRPFTRPYCIGGCREVTADGWIIGSMTDIKSKTNDPDYAARVYFFRIRADAATGR